MPKGIPRSTPSCSVEGCDRPQHARGFCFRDYARVRANGTPFLLTAEERFWAKVDQHDPDGCWPWIGSLSTEGYGKYGAGGQGAHRRAWMLAYGPIPQGMSVLHHCDNRPCCKPTDLFLGTQADNMADMLAKGRSHEQRKTHCPQGHFYDEANTIWYRGWRRCRACKRQRDRRRSWRREGM